MQEKKTVAQIAVDSILRLLDKGVSPWHQPWEGGAARSYDGRPYRGINRFLLACTPFDNPVFLTFKKAHELGGSIKKGEKSLPVFFWHIPDVVKSEDEEEDGKAEQHFFLRYYQVWNIAQCEGIPADKVAKVTPKEHAHEPIPEAEAIWNGYAMKPEVRFEGASAYYRPDKDEIVVPPLSRFPEREEFYSTLFHEAAHSTGHSSRLNRPKSCGFGSPEHGREELIAELAASILCGRCGITRTLENSAAYCANWSKAIRTAPAKAVVSAASAAEKAADFILGVAPGKEVA